MYSLNRLEFLSGSTFYGSVFNEYRANLMNGAIATKANRRTGDVHVANYTGNSIAKDGAVASFAESDLSTVKMAFPSMAKEICEISLTFE